MEKSPTLNIKNKIRIALRKVRNVVMDGYTSLALARQYHELRRKKQFQKDCFLGLRPRVPRLLKALDGIPLDDRLVFEDWKRNAERMRSTLSGTIPFDFLQDEVVLDTMFVKGAPWLREELTYLEKNIEHGRLARLLEEEFVGKPILSRTPYRTSHNSIHTLYHLERFAKKTNINFQKTKKIVEWGGGYGNMARIFHKYTQSRHQYVLIDHPVFACLQWLYLSCVFGPEQVFLLAKPTDKIRDLGISIVPLNMLEHQDIKADLFLSTWALSESSEFAIQTVLDRTWFGARHLLIAYDESFQAGTFMRSALQMSDTRVEPIAFLSRNFYAFK